MTSRLASAVRKLRSRKTDERGYVATVVAILIPTVFLACCALSVDTARWYVEAERAQRAADAAALAGVVWLPGDVPTAKSTALAAAKRNGFDDALPDVVVTVSVGEKPSQLKVEITSTITNQFGRAIGVNRSTVGRSAVADYAGGLSMGSPCNEFGSDPDPSASGNKSANCSDAGDFWANVGSPKADKPKGDAFQDNTCSSADGCTSGTNTDYDPNGYIYEVDVRQATSNLRLQAFDPALIDVGDLCDTNNLAGAKALSSTKTVVTDPATRYVPNTGTYCTGDHNFGSSTGTNTQVATNFTIRKQGVADDPTRPWTWPALTASDCPGAKTYPGYDGDLSKALNKTSSQYTANPWVAQYFRQWVTLCSLSSVAKGDKLAIQVKTNGVGSDNADGHNRFALRGYSTSTSAGKDNISISAFNKMAVYANVQGGSSRFFLTRVPSSAAGQTLNVSLFDIGDITGTGTLSFIAPQESGITFSNCLTVGKLNGTDADCKFNVDSSFGGRWQAVYIPIPSTYTCSDLSATGCWVKLKYDLSGTTQATDTTSWESSIDGDPVRLIQ